MLNFKSYKLALVLILVYFLLCLVDLFLASQSGLAERLSSTLGAAALTAAKALVGAFIAWGLGLRFFSLACAINIAFVVLLVSKILTYVLMGLHIYWGQGG